MGSRLILIFVVLFILQFSDAVQKRNIIDDLLAPIKNTIQEESNKAGYVLTDVTQAATSIIQTAMSSVYDALKNFNINVQAQVKKAQQQGKDVTFCLVESATKANNIVNKARNDMEVCTKAATEPVRNLIADLFDLGNQAVQLIAGYPLQLAKCAESGILGSVKCLFDTTSQVTARANLLGSSARSDTINLGIQKVQAIPKLGKCTSDGLSYAIKQFSELTTSDVSCILGALNSN